MTTQNGRGRLDSGSGLESGGNRGEVRQERFRLGLSHEIVLYTIHMDIKFGGKRALVTGAGKGNVCLLFLLYN